MQVQCHSYMRHIFTHTLLAIKLARLATHHKFTVQLHMHQVQSSNRL